MPLLRRVAALLSVEEPGLARAIQVRCGTPEEPVPLQHTAGTAPRPGRVPPSPLAMPLLPEASASWQLQLAQTVPAAFVLRDNSGGDRAPRLALLGNGGGEKRQKQRQRRSSPGHLEDRPQSAPLHRLGGGVKMSIMRRSSADGVADGHLAAR